MDENTINVIYLILVNTMINISYAVYSTVERSIVPSIIYQNKIQRINSIMTVINETLKTSAPLIGGLLVSINYIGVKELFLIISFSFFVSAFLQSFISYSYERKEHTAIFKDFINGFHYVKNQEILLKLLILVSIFNFFIEGYNIFAGSECPNGINELRLCTIGVCFEMKQLSRVILHFLSCL